MTPAHFKTLLWMILPGFMYVMIGQDIYQRLVACKSHKVALQTSVCSAILAMSVLPNWAVGIIIAASLSAILSTADSCLSAASSHFMTDFYLLYFAKDADPNDKRLVVVSQIFTVVAGAAAVVVSMTIPSWTPASTPITSSPPASSAPSSSACSGRRPPSRAPSPVLWLAACS